MSNFPGKISQEEAPSEKTTKEKPNQTDSTSVLKEKKALNTIDPDLVIEPNSTQGPLKKQNKKFCLF